VPRFDEYLLPNGMIAQVPAALSRQAVVFEVVLAGQPLVGHYIRTIQIPPLRDRRRPVTGTRTHNLVRHHFGPDTLAAIRVRRSTHGLSYRTAVVTLALDIRAARFWKRQVFIMCPSCRNSVPNATYNGTPDGCRDSWHRGKR
jgi:hypothetical protein